MAVLTRMALGDQDALLAEEREAGIEVRCAASPETTEFENHYGGSSGDRRVQRIGAVALPFVPEDLDALEGVHLAVEVAHLHAELGVVLGQVLRHAFGQRRHEHPFAVTRSRICS